MSGHLRGRLLVATPSLGDPNFEHTVVLVLAHADEGTLGVVLNRPSVTPVGQVLPAWEGVASEPPLLFLGGPVDLDNVIGLASHASSAARSGGHAGGDPIVDDVVAVDLYESPEQLGDVPRDVRLFAGSAGWGPRQLEGELDEGAWWVLDATRSDVFSAEPKGLWSEVLRRQPGRLAWFANALGDPSMN